MFHLVHQLVSNFICLLSGAEQVAYGRLLELLLAENHHMLLLLLLLLVLLLLLETRLMTAEVQVRKAKKKQLINISFG